MTTGEDVLFVFPRPDRISAAEYYSVTVGRRQKPERREFWDDRNQENKDAGRKRREGFGKQEWDRCQRRWYNGDP